MSKPEEVQDKALEVQEQKSIVAVGLTPKGGLLPTDMDGLWRLASIMAKSGFMPHGIETTEAVFVAVQMGLEVGLSPMQAVQNIAVINGHPAIYGDAQLGLVRSSGLLDDFDEKYEGEFPKDDFKAICIARRKGKRGAIRNEFSILDAKTALLWNKRGKQGQDTPWITYPKRMLKMRARAFTLRDGFADVLKGLRSVEEVRDIPFEGIELERTEGGRFEMAPAGEDQAQIIADQFWSAAEKAGIKGGDPAMVKHLADTAAFFKIEVPRVIAELVEHEHDLAAFLAGFLKKQGLDVQADAAEENEGEQASQAPKGEKPEGTPTEKASESQEAKSKGLKPGQRRTKPPQGGPQPEGKERTVICPKNNEATYESFCNRPGSCPSREGCPEFI